MKSWRTVIRPREEVLSGRFSQAEFAADVFQVVTGNADKNYQNPVIFFDRTCITEGMRMLLIQVAKRMNGADAEPVIQLQTAFGGGKTHTLIAVYHLVTHHQLSDLSGLGGLVSSAGLTQVPAAKVCMLDGNALSPGKPNQRPEIATNTLWGELGWQLLGPEGYKLVYENDQNGTSPGKTVLADLLRRASPCIVMFDELVAYMRQLDNRSLSGGTYEANLSFIQALTEAVKQVPQAMILASLPESEIEAGGDKGREVLRSLEKIFGRIQALWKPVTAEESFEIVRRRLFERDFDTHARDATCSAYLNSYRTYASHLPTELNETERYLSRMIQAYPIHPEVFDRLYENWSGLENFQKTRGVLKLMARVIYSLIQEENQEPLILPSSLPLQDNAVRNEFVQFLPAGWDPVITKDIDGPNATTKDIEQEARFASLSAARRVARTVFLATAPDSASITSSRNRGIDGMRILLGCLRPDETSSIYIDVLTRLTDRLHYWNTSGDCANLATRYWFDTRANLRQEVESRAKQFTPAEIQKIVETEFRKLLGRGAFIGGLHIFPNSADVPDDSELRLVVLSSAHGMVRDSTQPFEDTVKELLQQHGSRPRQYANRLLFLVPDHYAATRMERATRLYMAWNSLVEDSKSGNLNLDRLRSQEAEISCKQALDVMKRAMREAYRWLVVPHQEDAKTPTNRLEKEQLSTVGVDIVLEIEKVCVEQEWIINRWSPVHLHSYLKQFYWHSRPTVAARQFYEDCQRYLYLPRIASEKVLSDAVCAGATVADYFGIALEQSGDEFRGFQYAAPLVYSSTVLLIEPSRAKEYAEHIRQKQVREQVTRKENQANPPVIDIGVASTQVDLIHDPLSQYEVIESEQNYFQFTGIVNVPPHLSKSRLIAIAEDIIAILAKDPHAKISIKLEIDASYPEGVDEDIKRVVDANAKHLEFGNAEWE